MQHVGGDVELRGVARDAVESVGDGFGAVGERIAVVVDHRQSSGRRRTTKLDGTIVARGKAYVVLDDGATNRSGNS